MAMHRKVPAVKASVTPRMALVSEADWLMPEKNKATPQGIARANKPLTRWQVYFDYPPADISVLMAMASNGLCKRMTRNAPIPLAIPSEPWESA